MKSASANLLAHLAGETTTLATLWKCTLANGTVKAFTDHDRDLTFGGVTYLAASGYTPSAVQTSGAFNVDNLNLAGILDSPSITEQDLLAGLWDYAQIEISIVNWADLSHGALAQRKGRLGEVKAQRGRFDAELRGMMQAYSRRIGELYQPGCRADLGDSKCKVNLASFTVTGTLTGVNADNRTLTDSARAEANGYFDFGKITFTSGLNNGLSMEVKSYTVGQIVLQLPMPYACAVGDAYSMHAGCDKTLNTCKTRFVNVINFRGEPHLPGLDQLTKGAA